MLKFSLNVKTFKELEHLKMRELLMPSSPLPKMICCMVWRLTHPESCCSLSLAARNIGVKAYIVMPSDSSKVKVDAVRQYGGIITYCEPMSKQEKRR